MGKWIRRSLEGVLSMRRLGAGLLAAAAVAISASPAQGAEVIGEAHPSGSGGQTCGNLGGTVVQADSAGSSYAAPYDGVITSWGTRGRWSPVSLKIARLGAGDTFRILAADGPRTYGGSGGLETYPVRIPVRQGDVLAVQVAVANHYCLPGGAGDRIGWATSDVAPGQTSGYNGTRTEDQIPIQATIEPDEDGDGYGDETQDGCPGNPATGPCPLPTTLGQTFIPHNNSCEEITVFPLQTPGVVSAVQRDGVITSWSHQTFAGASGTAQLRILQPLGGTDYLLRAQDAARPVVPNAVNTFKVRIPVRVGDRIALAVTGALVPACGVNSSAWTVGYRQSLALGASGPFATDTGSDVDLSAYQEADADKDGYGDTTQDRCPTDPSTQGVCPVSPPPPPAETKACKDAKAQLKKAKAKLGKLKRNDAPAKKVKKAKGKVKKAKGKVKKAC